MSDSRIGVVGNRSGFENLDGLLEKFYNTKEEIVFIPADAVVPQNLSILLLLVDLDAPSWETQVGASIPKNKECPYLLIFNKEPLSSQFEICYEFGVDEIVHLQELNKNNFLRVMSKTRVLHVENNRRLQSLSEVNKKAESIKSQSLAKSQLLANLSKDIRTPLTGIMGSIQLLLESRLDHEQRELSDLILNSSHHLLDALNGVIDMAKLEVGELAIDVKSHDFANLLDAAFGHMSTAAVKKGKRFVLKSGVPAKARLDFDFKRVQYIVQHLADWLLNENESGAIGIEVAYLENDMLEFKYLNNAIDIFEEVLEMQEDLLFDDRLKDFDLEYCKELAQMMGGELKEVGSKNEKVQFILTVKAENKETESHPEVKKNEVRNYVGRIVVAEDNLINQKVISKLLNSVGIKPIIAYNGKVALEEVKKEKTDLVLMDIQMPLMNGFQATAAIRSLDTDIFQPRIVACSANVLQEVVNNSASLGMDGFLKKPLSKRNLVKELDKWLESKEVNPFRKVKELETSRY